MGVWLRPEWEYLELGDGDYQAYFANGATSTAEDYIQEMDLCSEGNWSDKYRGIDYDVVDRIPREILEYKIKQAELAAQRYTKTAERLHKELESYDEP